MLVMIWFWVGCSEVWSVFVVVSYCVFFCGLFGGLMIIFLRIGLLLVVLIYCCVVLLLGIRLVCSMLWCVIIRLSVWCSCVVLRLGCMLNMIV